jgi:signal transduction histidine kinase
MVAHPNILRVELVGRGGESLASLETSPEALVKQGSWTSDVFERGIRVVSPMQVSSSGGTRYVVIGYPVNDEAGTTVAALELSVTLESLENAFAALSLPDGSIVVISDNRNRILARSADAERYVGQLLEDTPPPSADAPPFAERTSVDGVERMYGRAVIAQGPWLVSVGIPMSVAVGKAASLWQRSLAILGLGLGGWLVIVMVLSGRFARSVGHLDAEATRIASGDFGSIDQRPMPTREFHALQEAFDRMLNRFNQTRAALDAQMAEERRMRQELQSLQRQVIRQERLAAVGQLVSGVAHEINNPLQAIMGFAELLEMQANLPPDVKADLHLIQKESARACGIIRNLALFARQQQGEAAPLRLSDVIASVADLRRRRLESEQIELRIEDCSTQPVLAVLTELQQVLLNFVVNAEQAIVMSSRLPGCITIRSRDEESRVVLEVEDTGPGIPPDHESRLFQPFFTTKPIGQGTGLGLSVSYGIIDSLGGRIGYRSAAAGGAIFYFELPVAAVEFA